MDKVIIAGKSKAEHPQILYEVFNGFRENC